MHSFAAQAPDPEVDHGHPEQKKAVVQKKATTCDLCTEHAEPSCVYACPHDAAHRVEPRDFFAGTLGQRVGKAGRART
jgi:Fe-S-cluster-containing hydrogenase component 2